MDNKEMATQFFDEDMRYEQIICIAAMCINYSWPSEVTDSFDGDWSEIVKALDIKLHESLLDDKEELFSKLYQANKIGFLIKVASPVPIAFHDDGSYTTNGWGYYQTKWIYVDDFNESFDLAIKWKEDMVKNSDKTKKEAALLK